MGRGKQDLKPDIVVKNYWRNNKQFADLFNAVLFDGEQVIRSDELEDMDTEESYVLEHKDYAESIGASRDNVKIRKKSTRYDVALCMLGLESQERIHYAMPMRVMGYDYGTYRKQYEDNAVKYKNGKLSEIREKAIKYATEHKVEKSVIMTVAGAANCKMDYNMLEKEGDADMCTVFEETRREGIAEGKAEEIVETGFEFGLSEEDILTRLQKKLNISLQKAQEYLSMYGKQSV